MFVLHNAHSRSRKRNFKRVVKLKLKGCLGNLERISRASFLHDELSVTKNIGLLMRRPPG